MPAAAKKRNQELANPSTCLIFITIAVEASHRRKSFTVTLDQRNTKLSGDKRKAASWEVAQEQWKTQSLGQCMDVTYDSESESHKYTGVFFLRVSKFSESLSLTVTDTMRITIDVLTSSMLSSISSSLAVSFHIHSYLLHLVYSTVPISVLWGKPHKETKVMVANTTLLELQKQELVVWMCLLLPQPLF